MKKTVKAAAPQADPPSSVWTVSGNPREQLVSHDWACPDCHHQHVTLLGGICVGCPCARTAPPSGEAPQAPKKSKRRAQP